MLAVLGQMLSDFLDWFQTFAIAWIIPVCFVLLVWFAWKMARALPSTKPKTIDPRSDSSVRWQDVAGVEEARAELEEIVEFLREPKRFQKLGARVPKGVLLYGPPGTGKTLLAKAVAHESGATFYFQSASAFVEMYVGLGAARIRKLFETARKNQPAIIFIDELDAVGATRGGGSNSREHDQTLNQLLVELDGFEESGQLVVMAASNRLEDLDSALLRPGRFDRQIHVAPPDLAGREAILGVHTRGKPIHEGVDMNSVARQTAGLTGAELANIANEAAIAAGRRGGQTIEQQDFNFGLDRVVAGMQQNRVITEKEKRVIAYHEAGHALVAWLMNQDVHKVTIVPRGRALGFMMSLPEEDRHVLSKEELEDWLKVTLAGRAAEHVVFGRITNGAANDLDRATAIARAMVFDWGMGTTTQSQQVRADNYALSEETKQMRDSEQRQITDTAYFAAIDLIEQYRPHLDGIASALLEKETLDSKEVDELLRDLAPTSDSSSQIGVELPRKRIAAAEAPAEPLLRADRTDPPKPAN